MKKSKFITPFNHSATVGERKRVFLQRFRPGAYIIKKGNNILYIGYSGSDVIKTMYRHFYPWNDQEQKRAVYNNQDKSIKVRVIYTNKPEQAARLERALIGKYKPKDNTNIPTTNTKQELDELAKYWATKEDAPF